MNTSTSNVQGQLSNGNAHSYSQHGTHAEDTIQTMVSKTENSRAIRDDRDFEVLCRITLEDLVDVSLVFQADVQTLGIDINV